MTMKYLRTKIIIFFWLALIGILSYSNSAFARRVRSWDNFTKSLYTECLALRYTPREAEKIASGLKKLFPDLGEISPQSAPEDKIKALVEKIRSRIFKSEELDYFNLPEVLENKKANCLGYAQIFYILGKALGLDIEIIQVYPGHAANLAKINTQYALIDISRRNVFSPYYISGLFNLAERYRNVNAKVLVLKNPQMQYYFNYPIIQRLNSRDISAMRITNKGIKELNEENYSKAITLLQKAIALDPTYAQAYNMLGVAIAESRQDYSEAIKNFNRAISLNPYYALAYSNRASARIEQSRYTEAAQDFKKAISIDPNCARAHLGLGIINYLYLGNPAAGLIEIKSALRLKPGLYSQIPPEIQNILNAK